MPEPEAVEMVSRLVRKCGEQAFQFARRLSGDVNLADDLVQEAYRRVLANWSRYDRKQPLENWFYAILRHISTDAGRRYERLHLRSIDEPVDGRKGESLLLAETIGDGQAPMDEALVRSERALAVRRALKRLNPEQRVALILCDMEGMNYDDIAEALGCAVGTVRSRVYRARTALRTRLSRKSAAIGVAA